MKKLILLFVLAMANYANAADQETIITQIGDRVELSDGRIYDINDDSVGAGDDVVVTDDGSLVNAVDGSPIDATEQ